MKKIVYILLAALLFTACEQWLDKPRPKGESEAKDMFKTEEGFQTVLIGVYVEMAKEHLYGKRMSIQMPEMFAQMWNAGANSDEELLKQFNFNSSRARMMVSESWMAYFKCIANLNILLDEIDAKQHLFSNGNYELIKGEALGLRAFLHFEVLRMWGPVPRNVDPSAAAIPYVKHVTKNVGELLSVSYRTVVDNILEDLDDAETLLAADPIIKFSKITLNTPSTGSQGTIGDEFHYFRDSRFNLFAVKATKARVYLWDGRKSEAFDCATEVIEGVRDGGSKLFTLADESELERGDIQMTTEQIFAVENYYLGKLMEPLFKPLGAINQTSAVVTELYEGNIDEIRFRGNRFWREKMNPGGGGGTTYQFLKYLAVSEDGTEEKYRNYVPLIRLSEMYFIAMECADDIEEAKGYFSTYRLARNLRSEYENELTEATLLRRLEKEYLKDFIGEGQMFYFYKRNAMNRISWPNNVDMSMSSYVIPKPDSQTSFE